jgi:hypothetical protein
VPFVWAAWIAPSEATAASVYYVCEPTMDTVLDVIQDVFEEDLTPDLIGAIADRNKVPQAKLSEFGQHLRCFADGRRAPPIKYDHLRPYIPVNHLRSYGADLSGIRLRYYGDDLDDLSYVHSSVDAISQYLLYCHSVAIDNTLAFTLDWFDPIGWAYMEERRPQLVHYLHFLHIIKPLIETGVVAGTFRLGPDCRKLASARSLRVQSSLITCGKARGTQMRSTTTLFWI